MAKKADVDSIKWMRDDLGFLSPMKSWKNIHLSFLMMSQKQHPFNKEEMHLGILSRKST